MNPPSAIPPVIASKTKLTPLTGLRFFAALHIFIFHIAAMPSPDEMRQIGERTQAAQTGEAGSESLDDKTREGAAAELGAEAAEAGQQPPAQAGASEAGGEGFMSRGLYKILPPPLARLFQRGFLSTSLFFMLSGFVLAYLYVDADGKQTISNREFFLSRWIRLYPLHFIMLPLLLPMVLMFICFFPTTTLWGFSVPKPAFVGASGVMSLLLVQAWCPEAALSWNFATWALSAVAFFYVMFPSTVKFLSRQSRSTLWTLFWLMPVLNLIPSIIFLWKTDGNSATNYFWSEVVMRTPLFWLPHFVMAIILCRLYKITRHDMTWCQGVDQRSGPSWGDLAIVVVLVICMTPDSFFQTLFCLGSKPPNFILRHGTLAPIYAVVLYNLALGRGWFARFLSLPTFEKLGEASFGIFIFQGPMIMPSMILFAIVRPLLELTLRLFTSNESFISDTLELFRVGMTVAIVVGLSIVSLRYFERPVARWLKKRLGLGAAA